MCLLCQVLSREVGEGFSISELLGGMPGWRGRAQQITNLQNKVTELKRQVKVLEGQRLGGGDVETGGGDKEERIRQLEQKRRTELEVCVCVCPCAYIEVYNRIPCSVHTTQGRLQCMICLSLV